MFIGIVGPSCSGKHEVMDLLTRVYDFKKLYLKSAVSNRALHTGQGSNTARIQDPMSQSAEFDTIEAMLSFVTLNWMNHYVTCDVNTVHGISILCKRPFFLLLSVESPMMMRYRRCVARCQRQDLPIPSLEQFVEMSDNSLYTISKSLTAPTPVSDSSVQFPDLESDEGLDLMANDNTSIVTSLLDQDQNLSTTSYPSESPSPIFIFNTPSYKLLSMSDLSILNNHSDLTSLQQSLEALDITNPDLLRPSWDSYFMYLANLAARRSNCMKRRVGCVLVRDKRVIATGYNGTPKNLKNCNDGGCSRCNQATPCGRGLDRCLCMHAEENALLEAGRERIGTGSTIYCNTCPCLGCAIKIVQVGISQVVYSESYGMDELTAEVFRKAGIDLRQHATPGIKLDQSIASYK
ncbi:Deoxycytidine monophosphate (dCMP) deaminase [Lobosporangium transversale]|uniref:Deoxycytidylate deaminase n=1 Tax=Lobosporangium transversale TaxID=64571 RepID=A0A1Y2GLS4_9FUNG|nr:cytidine deaminase-like protein [Lobosporangium transversale]KAF9919275.1 Deoxycytidine monophosphate (dCMP) deaminase [Lobosporangium transversale]ORZ11263.1 cytidine deaminase-like protein [Lobosporangium transversale]|eukprot:XP_021879578.1 cytidine deaminase-like protein [Lobosporangium transversale]